MNTRAGDWPARVTAQQKQTLTNRIRRLAEIHGVDVDMLPRGVGRPHRPLLEGNFRITTELPYTADQVWDRLERLQQSLPALHRHVLELDRAAQRQRRQGAEPAAANDIRAAIRAVARPALAAIEMLELPFDKKYYVERTDGAREWLVVGPLHDDDPDLKRDLTAWLGRPDLDTLVEDAD